MRYLVSIPNLDRSFEYVISFLDTKEEMRCKEEIIVIPRINTTA
jgi:hypothetical protein